MSPSIESGSLDSLRLTIVIEEKGDLISNQIYEAATANLRTLICDSTKPERFKVSKTVRQKESTVDIVKNVQIIDYFGKIRLKWMLCAEREESIGPFGGPFGGGISKKHLELSFDRGSEQDVLDSYLANIVDRYERIQNEKMCLKLYTRHTVLSKYHRGSVCQDEGEE